MTGHPGRPTALLLDLDGTLVDSEATHRRGYAAFFAHRGWDVPDLSIFTGRRAEDVFASEPGPWAGLDPRALHAEALPFVPDDPPVPVAGARPLVLAARDAGVPVAIVTSAGPGWVDLSLDALGASVDVVVTAEDVVDGKPDPAGYLLAASRLDVDPASVAVVEDSPAGVRAAVAAGVRRVLGVSTTHAADLLLAAGAVDVHEDLTGMAGVLLPGTSP